MPGCRPVEQYSKPELEADNAPPFLPIAAARGTGCALEEMFGFVLTRSIGPGGRELNEWAMVDRRDLDRFNKPIGHTAGSPEQNRYAR
jgi:hypothetical protein